MRKAMIYGLACPDTGEVRYIGKAVNTRKRYDSHMRERRRRTPLYDWLGSMRSKGKAPVMVELASAFDWEATERTIIAQYRADGAKILNVADGGDQPKSNSDRNRENAAKQNARRTSDPIAYANHSLLRAAGQMVRYTCNVFTAEKHARLAVAVARLKALAADSPEELFARIVKST